MCCVRKTAHKLKHFLSACEKINKRQELELIVTIICQNYTFTHIHDDSVFFVSIFRTSLEKLSRHILLFQSAHPFKFIIITRNKEFNFNEFLIQKFKNKSPKPILIHPPYFCVTFWCNFRRYDTPEVRTGWYFHNIYKFIH